MAPRSPFFTDSRQPELGRTHHSTNSTRTRQKVDNPTGIASGRTIRILRRGPASLANGGGEALALAPDHPSTATRLVALARVATSDQLLR